MARKYVTPGKKTSPGLLKRLGIGILGGMVGGLLTFGGLYLAMGSSLTSTPETTTNSGVQDSNGQT
ncbi:MAG: serine protease, partial [Enterococcus casseliflavus]